MNGFILTGIWQHRVDVRGSAQKEGRKEERNTGSQKNSMEVVLLGGVTGGSGVDMTKLHCNKEYSSERINKNIILIHI